MQEVIGSTPIFSTEGVNENKKPIRFAGWAFCLVKAPAICVDSRQEKRHAELVEASLPQQ